MKAKEWGGGGGGTRMNNNHCPYGGGCVCMCVYVSVCMCAGGGINFSLPPQWKQIPNLSVVLLLPSGMESTKSLLTE